MYLGKHQNLLLVYIEPTPYILGLVKAIRSIWLGQVDVLFLSENISQNWNIDLKKDYTVLPKENFKKISVIKNIFLTKKYSCVHLAGWGRLFLWLVFFISKLKRIPVTIESDTTFHYTKPLWTRGIKKLFYPLLFSWVDFFFPGGTRQRQYLEYYGVPPEKLIPVQMTVDTVGMRRYAITLNDVDKLQIRERYGIKKDDVLFLYVGRLEPRKGIKNLISAFNQVKCHSATLLLVGEGTLQSHIESAQRLNTRICCSGRLSGHGLIEVYFAADVFVLPSYLEPWGLVVNEAMAVGLPVIVSDRVGCVDDLIDHHENGLIVSAEEVAELKNAMEYMISDPVKRKMMASNSVKKIADWTLENEAKKICRAWHQLSYT